MIGIVAYVIAASIAASSSSIPPTELLANEELGFGDRGAAVAALNDALDRAGFHPDDGDLFGPQTRHSVYALQKHHGLTTDGRFSPFMWDLLAEPVELPWRPEASRVEIDW